MEKLENRMERREAIDYLTGMLRELSPQALEEVWWPITDAYCLTDGHKPEFALTGWSFSRRALFRMGATGPAEATGPLGRLCMAVEQDALGLPPSGEQSARNKLVCMCASLSPQGRGRLKRWLTAQMTAQAGEGAEA